MKSTSTLLALSLPAYFFSAFAEKQVVLHSGHGKADVPVKNVAIIGAGAGGASTAYHLHKYAADQGIAVNITVFERNHYIGGRSTTVYAYDSSSEPVELGASNFVSVNKILLEAVREFNLSTEAFQNTRADIPGSILGVWNGEEFVVTQEARGTWWNTGKLLWRYGLAPIRTMNLMKSTTGKLFQMYDAPHFPFSSLSQVVYDLGLSAVTSATGEQYLRENGIGTLFAKEIIQASTRMNYAQNLPFIHGLAAMVCMATDGAMSVRGGNWKIFDGMVKAAGATVLVGTEVVGVEKHGNGNYSIAAKGVSEANTVPTMPMFDAVVLAAPNQYSNTTFTPELHHEPDKIPYVELHVTLFTSPHLLSPAYFNLAPDKAVPHLILTTLPGGEPAREGADGAGSTGFFSISLLRPVNDPKTGDPEYLYKILSPTPTNDTWLASLLHKRPADVSGRDITWTYRKVWNSYPYAYTRVTFGEIKLDENVWYTSGIESFISTMETSALMGKNVARLIVDTWSRETAKRAGMQAEEVLGQ